MAFKIAKQDLYPLAKIYPNRGLKAKSLFSLVFGHFHPMCIAC